jgi:hypothetical protein
LLFTAPTAFATVRRPSPTVTILVPSNQRVVVVGVPLATSTPSTWVAYTLSMLLGSPHTTRTL